MSTDDVDADGTSSWTQPRFVIAAVVVALIAVFGVVLAVTGPADGDPAPRADPTSAPPTAQPDDDDSVCGLEPGDQTVPVVAPPDTRWELVGRVAVPTAPDAIGPGVVDAGLRMCFARSPLGALYAAVNTVAALTDPATAVGAIEQLAAPGTGRDAALAELERRPPADAAGGIQVAGFTFLNYSRESAVVDLAIRADNGGVGHIPMTMRWEDGDWKAVLPPDGNLAATVRNIPDLTGYAAWSGV